MNDYEEQDTEGSMIMESGSDPELETHSSECDTYPLSEPSPEGKCMNFNRMFSLERSDCPSTETSGQISEYMLMAGHSIASTAQLNAILFDGGRENSRSLYLESDLEENDHLNTDTLSCISATDEAVAVSIQAHTNAPLDGPEEEPVAPQLTLQLDEQNNFNEDCLFHDIDDTTGFSTSDSITGYIDCSNSVTEIQNS